MALKLITPASTYPVSLATAKLHLKVEVADDDALINAMITSATEMAEQELGRALMAQTWELTLDQFPEAFELTRVPVQSITSVKYYDAAGVQQTMGNTLYALDSSDDTGMAYVVPAYGGVWPTPRDQINAVSVRFVAGYTTVPEPINQWILLMVAAMYENRSAFGQYQSYKHSFADRLLDRYKVWSL